MKSQALTGLSSSGEENYFYIICLTNEVDLPTLPTLVYTVQKSHYSDKSVVMEE